MLQVVVSGPGKPLLWEQGVAGSNPAAPTWKARHGNELPCRAFLRYRRWGRKWGRLFPFFSPHTALAHLPRLIHDCQERLGVWLLIVGQKGLRILPTARRRNIDDGEVFAFRSPLAPTRVPKTLLKLGQPRFPFRFYLSRSREFEPDGTGREVGLYVVVRVSRLIPLGVSLTTHRHALIFGRYGEVPNARIGSHDDFPRGLWVGNGTK